MRARMCVCQPITTTKCMDFQVIFSLFEALRCVQGKEKLVDVCTFVPRKNLDLTQIHHEVLINTEFGRESTQTAHVQMSNT